MSEASSMDCRVGQCCEHCDDGDGFSVFPYYGTAPHTHALPTPTHPTDWIGSTRLLPRDQWGDDFREDPDCPGLGTYLRCEHCGAGELPNDQVKGLARQGQSL